MREWQNDGVAFARDVFPTFVPDPWQHGVLKAWTSKDPKDQRIALQACAGPGKSAVEAICGWQFMTCAGDEGYHPNGYAISITRENLRDNLWKELQVWRGRSELITHLFEWQKEQIFSREYPATWWLRARAFAKAADAESQGRTLSGLHGRFICYLIDEGGDMPTSLARTAEQGLSTADIVFGKILISGNPTSQGGALYDCAVNRAARYRVFRITGDPDDPMRSSRINLEWARQQVGEYGRENPWVMAFILGKFPPTALNALFSADDLREAMGRKIRADRYEFSQKRLGIDVARFGDDATVITPRQGLRIFKRVVMRNAKSHDIAARIITAKLKWGSELEFIDATGGWGAGAADACELAGYPLIEVNSSSNANDRRFFNRRSENYFKYAQWVKNGGTLPNEPRLIPQLVNLTYWLDKGRLRVVEKDQVKILLQGRSPDEADADSLTFALEEMPADVQELLPQTPFRQALAEVNSGGVVSEYDPLEAI